jgi:hypothetical protein
VTTQQGQPACFVFPDDHCLAEGCCFAAEVIIAVFPVVVLSRACTYYW